MLAAAAAGRKRDKEASLEAHGLLLGPLGRAALQSEDEEIARERGLAAWAWRHPTNPLPPEQLGGLFLARQIEKRP
jgi:hypothetical protein